MNELTRTTWMTARKEEIARRRNSARSPRLEPSAISTEAGTLLLDVDVVGQFVDVALGAREVRLELMAGRGDRFDDAVGELAILEADGQSRGDLVPETGRHFL